MSTQSTSTLSKKRIILSLSIFVLIPIIAHILNFFLKQYTISLMFAINIGTAILIFYDWNLFALHYNRAKAHVLDTVIFSVIGFIVILVWIYIGSSFLKANIIIPSSSDLTMYGYARPGMIIAFSFMQATAVSIGFKCLTDRFDVAGQELPAILFSGLLFGLLLTLNYLPYFDISLFFRTYVYNIILSAVLSYLYNQTHSFIPGLIAMGSVYFVLMIQTIL